MTTNKSKANLQVNLLKNPNISTSPEIIKRMNGCTVLLRFALNNNEQVSATIKELLISSYAEKLFSQNG